MRKISFSVVMLFAVIFSNGQGGFGIKGGLNVAGMNVAGPVEKKYRKGFHAGAMLYVQVSDKLRIQPEFFYSQKGFTAPSVYFLEDTEYRLQYISVPVLAGYRISKVLSVLLGPEPGFLASATSVTNSAATDVSSTKKKVDLSFDLGVACKLSKYAGVDLRYSHGLTSAGYFSLRDRNNLQAGGADNYHRVVQLGVFYLLR